MLRQFLAALLRFYRLDGHTVTSLEHATGVSAATLCRWLRHRAGHTLASSLSRQPSFSSTFFTDPPPQPTPPALAKQQNTFSALP